MEKRPLKHRLTEAIARYGFFIFFSAASLWIVLRFRNVLMLFGVYIRMWGNDMWVMDIASFVVFAGLYLAFIGYMEHCFLGKITPFQADPVMPVLLKRAKMVTLYEGATAVFALGLGWLIQFLITHR